MNCITKHLFNTLDFSPTPCNLYRMSNCSFYTARSCLVFFCNIGIKKFCNIIQQICIIYRHHNCFANILISFNMCRNSNFSDNICNICLEIIFYVGLAFWCIDRNYLVLPAITFIEFGIFD